MSAGFDLGEELVIAVGDAEGAMEFLRRFAAAHASPLVASDGYGAEELRAAAVRLGYPLPDSLRELYRLIGKRDDLTRVQDYLLTPAELRIDESGKVLVFRVENQNVAQWGVPLDALREPDPRVVFQVGAYTSAEGTWQPFMDRLSWACLEMVLSEWMLSEDAFSGNRELDEETVTELEARFSRLPMPEYPLWAEPNSLPTRWFYGAGTILRDDAGIWLWARAESPEGLATVQQALPGEWMMLDSD